MTVFKCYYRTDDMSRGIHSKPNDGHSYDWLTPPEIIKSLGRFAIDPCAHPKQFYRTADLMVSPPKDGLTHGWVGRVWLNPPYGSALKHWIKRLSEHGNGIALVPARTEVEAWFWPYIWERADAILFIRGRLYFLKPDGSKTGNAGHGSVLVAYGTNNVEALKKCRIGGRLIELLERKEVIQSNLDVTDKAKESDSGSNAQWEYRSKAARDLINS